MKFFVRILPPVVLALIPIMILTWIGKETNKALEDALQGTYRAQMVKIDE